MTWIKRYPRVRFRWALRNAHLRILQQVFLDFVLSYCVRSGVEKLNCEKLAPLLMPKYHNAIADAVADLGRPEEIGTFSPASRSIFKGRMIFRRLLRPIFSTADFGTGSAGGAQPATRL
jgi:hypothetical protein